MQFFPLVFSGLREFRRGSVAKQRSKSGEYCPVVLASAGPGLAFLWEPSWFPVILFAGAFASLALAVWIAFFRESRAERERRKVSEWFERRSRPVHRGGFRG